MKDRISCFFTGGLGNQLFQVSNVLAQSWKSGKEPVFVLEWGRLDATGWAGNHPKNYKGNIFRNLKFIDSFNGINPIVGHNHSSKFFLGYDDRICDTFSPPPEFIAAMETKYPQLKQKNTVSVHVRRGDYLDVDYINHIDYTQYVPNALKRIPNHSTVFVFTNDKQWVKDNLQLPNMVLVDEDADYKELWLMSLCHHNIIANSTFSWWGAFLNRHPTKIVCYPDKWYDSSREVKFRSRDIPMPGWTRTHTEKFRSIRAGNVFVEDRFTKLIDKSKVQVLFELGSRDGLFIRDIISCYEPKFTYSFECSPVCIPNVRKNTVGLPNFHLCEKAVWKFDGTVDFFIHKDVGSSSILELPSHCQKVTVPCTTLDSFCREHNIDKVDLICADIEGAEIEAFRDQRILDTVTYVISEVITGLDKNWKKGYPTIGQLDKVMESHGLKRVPTGNIDDIAVDVLYVRDRTI